MKGRNQVRGGTLRTRSNRQRSWFVVSFEEMHILVRAMEILADQNIGSRKREVVFVPLSEEGESPSSEEEDQDT